jgi:hypothetical protein
LDENLLSELEDKVKSENPDTLAPTYVVEGKSGLQSTDKRMRVTRVAGTDAATGDQTGAERTKFVAKRKREPE